MKQKRDDQHKFYSVMAENVPFSYAEAYKSLRTNLNYIAATESASAIIITSAMPEESKSTVALNLAQSLASDGKKVVIVDCDLRKPVLHKYLKMEQHESSLADVLAGKMDILDAVQKYDNLSVVAAGRVPQNPSELLGKPIMKAAVKKLKEAYDFVILDAPPITVVTDAAVLGESADGAILVIRSNYAPVSAVRLAKERLERVNIKLLGAVLTRFDARNRNRKYGYSYSYNYNYGYHE